MRIFEKAAALFIGGALAWFVAPQFAVRLPEHIELAMAAAGGLLAVIVTAEVVTRVVRRR